MDVTRTISMPTITRTLETLDAVGVSYSDLLLASGEGVVLAQ